VRRRIPGMASGDRQEDHADAGEVLHRAASLAKYAFGTRESAADFVLALWCFLFFVVVRWRRSALRQDRVSRVLEPFGMEAGLDHAVNSGHRIALRCGCLALAQLKQLGMESVAARSGDFEKIEE
jgi:hypothetical protein